MEEKRYYAQVIWDGKIKDELKPQWIKSPKCEICMTLRSKEFREFARIIDKQTERVLTSFYLCPEGMLVWESHDFWLFTGRSCLVLPVLEKAKQIAQSYDCELLFVGGFPIDANAL